MLISELIRQYPAEKQLEFEYCFYDRNMRPVKDDNLSYSGPAGLFGESMLQRAPEVLRLYATCGECYDFEIAENSAERVVLRFVDFR